jgi:hypothetical protein
MKNLILLTASSLSISSCTTPPLIQGEFISKDGRIKVHPDGRFEIVIEPRNGK